jgi:hypothetical protein
MTPPAPANRSAACSDMKNGILRRDGVHDWVNLPLSNARFGYSVEEVMRKGSNIRSSTKSRYDKPEYFDTT